MAVLTEFRVPASEFVLADTLTSVPDARIEIKRVVAGVEEVTPYFWVFSEDLNAFETALHDDPDAVEILTLEEDQEGERFFRVTWRRRTPNLVTAISNAKATILNAVNETDGTWELKILFPNREELSTYRDYCAENDISFDLERVYRPGNPPERGQYDLTERQQAAPEAAYDGGYFNVPRDMTLTEIAEQVGISRNALSNRLRRGLRNLLANTIIHKE